eukprot:TRINITY_DN9510_c0_g1_i1.p1 TRINITY_DN9510_c0_g1~~TRINITY_DN9510_c0_g1_i1.p1  ORF type:complete len:414 (+),score=103.14 TRINITY_DN9510_c0_g1_i1:102-1343(+)
MSGTEGEKKESASISDDTVKADVDESTKKSSAEEEVIDVVSTNKRKREEIGDSAGADDADDDDILTMTDVLEEQQAVELRASEVPGGDLTRCTYADGYATKQSILVCLTCFEETKEMAGVCFGCAEKCHATHNVTAIWTRRNFRCDCGNSKFPKETPCCFEPNKESTNSKNKYNHNFEGLFCYCRKPEDEAEGYIQCYICEDWYHPACLGTDNLEAERLLCKLCLEKYPFLSYLESEAQILPANSVASGTAPTTATDGSTATTSESSSTEAPSETSNKTCKVISKPPSNSDLYMKEGWKKSLCQCADCLQRYKELNLEFLIDEDENEDEAEAEANGNSASTKAGESLHTAGLKALARLPVDVQIEQIHAYNDLRNQLFEYLETFSRENKVVTKADIDRFFEALGEKSAKRRKM